MITDSVYTIPRDSRFSFKHAVFDGRTVVMSGEKSFVGRVTFDPGAVCRNDESCYSGFSLASTCEFNQKPNYQTLASWSRLKNVA